MIKEFTDFLQKQNALALAIGVIIGGATGKVVTAIVNDLIMPLIGLVMPAGDWRQAQFILSKSTDAAGAVTVNAIKYGDFIGSFVDFAIIAFVVFIITKAILPKEAPPAPTKSCNACLETVPAAATKCKACTSPV
ncbi:MAG TPA: large conductance mechanosensitive channel protein MscL [Candidatus Obscuribacter sp.]|nr:large conductance mechanosensitive channel protein MscL [Candidatus Obscuribacter sp.]HNA73809.1 large conductance mechanosensitive channel protein MscL [Candidatus Obscuribacter sp.]HND05437.1 large conductance mechanosensitive channel protein MscL [Candidatus Obscuribacter sp.]